MGRPSRFPGTRCERCGLLVAVLAAKVAPLGAAVDVAVLDVGNGGLGRARAEVEAQQRLGSDEAAPVDEVVGAELISFEGVPGTFEDGGPFVLGADAVEPIVAGDEIAAGVAHHRHCKLLDLRGYILAEATLVGEGRAGFVNTGVHGAAEVFQEGAEEPAVEIGTIAGLIDDGPRGPAAGLGVADASEPGGRGDCRAGRAELGQKLSSGGGLGHGGNLESRQ
jgi:hypothetical protein